MRLFRPTELHQLISSLRIMQQLRQRQQGSLGGMGTAARSASLDMAEGGEEGEGGWRSLGWTLRSRGDTCPALLSDAWLPLFCDVALEQVRGVAVTLLRGGIRAGEGRG